MLPTGTKDGSASPVGHIFFHCFFSNQVAPSQIKLLPTYPQIKIKVPSEINESYIHITNYQKKNTYQILKKNHHRLYITNLMNLNF